MSTKGRVSLGNCIHIKEDITIRGLAKSGSAAYPEEKGIYALGISSGIGGLSLPFLLSI